MERRIVGFHRDDASDWVADLSCGHGFHVRHSPPWHERPWVEDDRERAARIGGSLDCLRCDRRELPDDASLLRRTATFDAASMPAGLRRRHTTKPGVWAKICVTSGALIYRIHAPFDETERLERGRPGIVVPEVEHDVTPAGDVAFSVAFYRRQGD